MTAGNNQHISPGQFFSQGKDKLGMMLQYCKHGDHWRDCLIGGKVVISPIDIGRLSARQYRLVG